VQKQLIYREIIDLRMEIAQRRELFKTRMEESKKEFLSSLEDGLKKIYEIKSRTKAKQSVLVPVNDQFAEPNLEASRSQEEQARDQLSIQAITPAITPNKSVEEVIRKCVKEENPITYGHSIMASPGIQPNNHQPQLEILSQQQGGQPVPEEPISDEICATNRLSKASKTHWNDDPTCPDCESNFPNYLSNPDGPMDNQASASNTFNESNAHKNGQNTPYSPIIMSDLSLENGHFMHLDSVSPVIHEAATSGSAQLSRMDISSHTEDHYECILHLDQSDFSGILEDSFDDDWDYEIVFDDKVEPPSEGPEASKPSDLSLNIVDNSKLMSQLIEIHQYGQT